MSGCEQSVYGAFVRTKMNLVQFINRMSMEYCVDQLHGLVSFLKSVVIFVLIELHVLYSGNEIVLNGSSVLQMIRWRANGMRNKFCLRLAKK